MSLTKTFHDETESSSAWTASGAGGFEQVVHRALLGEVAGRAGLQGAQCELVLRVHAQHQHAAARAVPHDALQRLHAVHARHADVEDDEIEGLGLHGRNGAADNPVLGGRLHLSSRNWGNTYTVMLDRMLKAMVDGLGHNAVTAYLTMMTPRLIELHRVLKPTGSLYLHCDPTVSHYLKIILDTLFGPMLFQNEII